MSAKFPRGGGSTTFFSSKSIRIEMQQIFSLHLIMQNNTVLPAKSDSGVMFCLQSDQGFIIDRSRVY